MMIETELVAVLSRAMVYAASISTAGAALFYLTFPAAANHIRPHLRAQLLAGAVVLALVEPLRYGLFQLAIAGGDAGVGFAPDMRWIYLESPGGHAALARLAGTALLLVAGLRSPFVAAIGAITVIGSYLLEGHTSDHELRYILGVTVALHLLIAHWWFGALMPLGALLRDADTTHAHGVAVRFGRIAALLVPILGIAGLIALLILVDWQIDPASTYQQRFALKLVAVTCVLSIAAVNKLWLTPSLKNAPETGRNLFRRSLRWETAFAITVVGATAWLTATAPGAGH